MTTATDAAGILDCVTARRVAVPTGRAALAVALATLSFEDPAKAAELTKLVSAEPIKSWRDWWYEFPELGSRIDTAAKAIFEASARGEIRPRGTQQKRSALYEPIPVQFWHAPRNLSRDNEAAIDRAYLGDLNEVFNTAQHDGEIRWREPELPTSAPTWWNVEVEAAELPALIESAYRPIPEMRGHGTRALTDWSQREWWPLAIALAWIIDPRLGLHPKIADLSIGDIRLNVVSARGAVVSYLPQEQQPQRFSFKLDFDRAWDKLRAAAADDKVALRGIPAVRGGFPTHWIDRGLDPIEIRAAAIEHLMLRWEDEDCLGPMPADKSLGPPLNGRFWRVVMVSRTGLMKLMNPAPVTEAIEPSLDAAHQVGELRETQVAVREEASAQEDASHSQLSPPKTTVKPIAKAESDCRKWLVTLMKASLSERPKSKDALYREAVQLFKGLGQPQNVKPSRRFEQAWRDAIAQTGATWYDSGRPRKNLRT